MRLQLARTCARTLTVLCTVALAGCGARHVDLRSSTYVDNDRTTINTSTVTARGSATETITVSGRYLVDYTSSASVDVVSAATGRWTEFRHEVEASTAYADGTNTVSLGYVHSNEPDWFSHNFAAGGSRDFYQHNLTLGLGATYVDNSIGRADDANFAEDMRVFGVAASAVVVASPNDLLSFNYTFAENQGYQSSPYRFVFFLDAEAPGQILSQEESMPRRRLRHAITVRWNRHVFTDSTFRSHVRGYFDDWGLSSVTTGTEYIHGLTEQIELGFAVRGYAQQGTSFYEDVYATRRKFMTADRELSTFYDVFGTGRVTWRTERLRAELKLVGFSFVFKNFSRLPHREGLIAEAALGASF